MIRPPRLRPGDPIAIIAPSGPVPADRFEIGRARLAERYDLRWSPRVLERTGYLAGDDDARLAEITTALDDDAIGAIVCARGGYGAMRLLQRLPAAMRRPKLLVGFSDVTALHAWAQRAGVASVHGPVVTHLATLPEGDQAALYTLLEGAIGAPIDGLRSIAAQAVGEGPLVGGNLEVLSHLVGTPWAFPLDGAVLLLEEVGERPYRLDRLLTHLGLAGAWERVAAVVVGELIRCDAPEGGGPSAIEVVEERLGRLGVPVLVGLPVGHGDRNRALGLGVRVRVDGRRGELTPLEPVAS